ncbi:MAG: hypothetical protein ACLR2E_14035 [Lachnospiraceae bacterium]
MGIAAAVMGLIYGLTDVRYRRSYLETGLLDMLENSGNTAAVVKNGKQPASRNRSAGPFRGEQTGERQPGAEFCSSETATAAADKLPSRKIKGKQRQNAAGKKDLKADLSRIRAS